MSNARNLHVVPGIAPPTAATMPERSRVGYLKMFLNYIALSVNTEGHFLRLMRQTQTEIELFNLCSPPKREVTPSQSGGRNSAIAFSFVIVGKL